MEQEKLLFNGLEDAVMDMLYDIETALDVVVSVELSNTTVMEAKVVAHTLEQLQENGFKLELTNNGEYTHAYVENEWGNALLHLKSSHKATIVVLDRNGASLRLYFEYNATDSILVDCTSNSLDLVETAHSFVKTAYEKHQNTSLAA